MSDKIMSRNTTLLALDSESKSNAVPTGTTASRTGSETKHRARRILHVVSSLKVGGMEQFVVRVAAAQRQQGHEVSILALQDGALAEDARRLGVPTETLSRNRFLRVLGAYRTFGNRKPDVIHAHNITSLHYAALGKSAARCHMLITCHGRGRLDVRAPKASEWAAADAVIAVSKTTVGQITAPGVQDRLGVIYNGIELPDPSLRREKIRQAVRIELKIKEETIVGILVARIDGIKGHETLLRALHHLKEERNAGTRSGQAAELTVLFAGDGKERMAMEALAEELGLGEEDVRFLGFRSDVPNLLAASDLFILPSHTEGLPLSMLEAMAQRLPVIATPVGGIPELMVDGEHGYLVPVQDVEALSSALERLVGDADLRAAMAEAGYARVQESFTFERMLQEYEALYERLMEGSVRA